MSGSIINARVSAIITNTIYPVGASLIRPAIKQAFPLNGMAILQESGRSLQGDPIAPFMSQLGGLGDLVSSAAAIQDHKDHVIFQLSRQPLYASGRAGLQRRLVSFRLAATVEETENTGQDLWAFVSDGHSRVFFATVRMACLTASATTGFAIERPPRPSRPGHAEFAATDGHGRTLFTTIRAERGGYITIDTRIVGGSDGRCRQAIDDYYLALIREGVCLAGQATREAACDMATGSVAAASKGRAGKLETPTTNLIGPRADLFLTQNRT